MVLGEACTGLKNKNAAHELSPYRASQLLAFLYSLTLKKLVGNIAFGSSVRSCIRSCLRHTFNACSNSGGLPTRVLKFHI